MTWRGRRLGLLLASSSTAALLIGSNAPAFAACYSGPFPAGDVGNQTGVCITNTSFSGNVGSTGTISPNGIVVTGSSVGGTISDSGTLTGGISIDHASTITSFGDGLLMNGPLLQGGIQNAGTVVGSAIGIHVRSDTFSGSIVNSAGGTISGLNAHGIYIDQVGTFAGGISNAGLISSYQNGIRVSTVNVFGNNSAGGGIVNSGTISSAGLNGTGIYIAKVQTFFGGVTNSGRIAATQVGIRVNTPTFVGGIVNSGTGLIATTHNGIEISGGETFAGGVSNAGTIMTASAGAAIRVGGVFQFFGSTFILLTSFSGGVSNSGLLAASGGDAILVNGVSSFSGGVVNQGGATVLAANDGISIANVVAFSDGIRNAGTIGAGQAGIHVTASTFVGGIVNSASGVITAGQGGIHVGQGETFAGGITNAGTISSSGNGAPIFVGEFVGPGLSSFTGGITNSGTLIADIRQGIQVIGVSSFAGGILNNGTGVITAAHNSGITVVEIGNFSGGISNAGTISAGNHGIDVCGCVSTFTGGITNSGMINARGTGIVANSVQSFGGAIANSGTISAGAIGIAVGGLGTFTDDVTNSGRITAVSSGILVGFMASYGGHISNSGTIESASRNGIVIVGMDTFSGGVTNSGTILASPSAVGILINDIGSFTGDIVNAATGSMQGGIAMRVANVGTFQGSVINSGGIDQAVAGLYVTNVGVFGTSTAGGGVVNSGSISVSSVGVLAGGVATFLGGITNAGSGTIAAPVGILLDTIGTFAGGISNAGRIIAANTGIQVHGGVGFATGSHVVNSGTISGGIAAIDLTQATSPVTIDQTAGLIAGAIKLSSAGNADVLNVFGGSINGNVVGAGNAGTVNYMLGSGSFTYAAPFAMTGLQFVNFLSGTAFVDGSIQSTFINITSGGTAAGTGTLLGGVFLHQGGTLMPGNPANQLGTLNITGSLTFHAGSIYSVHVTPTASSSTTIAGATTINTGGTVQVTLLQNGKYNQTYTIVTASGGVGGTFNPAVTNTGAFTFNGTETLTYDPTHVYLTLSGMAVQRPLSSPGNLSVNQQNVLDGINAFIQAGNTLPPGFQGLFNLSGPALADALTHLSGENNAGFFQGAFQAGNSFLNLMVNPFLDGRFGSGGGFGAAMGFAADEPPALPQAALAFASAMPVKAARAPASFEQRFSAWGAAYGGSGRVLGDPVLGSHDTSASAAAVAAGVDYRLSPDTVLGIALAGGGTSWNVTANLGGGSSDMFQAGVYGSHRWGAAYVSGALAYNFHDVTTNRTLTIAGTDMLQARFQANGVGARLEGGYRYATPWLGITPYAAAQVQSIALPGYGETATAGSNQFALNFASQTATTTRTELGAWLDRSARMDSGALLTLYGRAAWAHDFGNSPSASAIFQALPGSNFIVNGAVPARDGALVTGAAQYALPSGWSFLAKFDGEFSSTTSIYSGSGMVKKMW